MRATTHGTGLGMFAGSLSHKAKCLLGASERPRRVRRVSGDGRRIGSSSNKNTVAIDSQACDLAVGKGNNNNDLVAMYRNSNGRSGRDALRSLPKQ